MAPEHVALERGFALVVLKLYTRFSCDFLQSILIRKLCVLKFLVREKTLGVSEIRVLYTSHTSVLDFAYFSPSIPPTTESQFLKYMVQTDC